ncbi:MAG: hypothetical protein WDM86_08785 [Rhizomicrobium sp.]
MGISDVASGNMVQALNAIASTTDVTSLLREVAEAYRLTITLERDIQEINLHYRNLEQVNSHVHDEIMSALDRAYSERAEQVAMIERIVHVWTEREQYDLAHSATMKMMDLLKTSPLDKALEARQALAGGPMAIRKLPPA